MRGVSLGTNPRREVWDLADSLAFGLYVGGMVYGGIRGNEGDIHLRYSRGQHRPLCALDGGWTFSADRRFSYRWYIDDGYDDQLECRHGCDKILRLPIHVQQQFIRIIHRFDIFYKLYGYERYGR